MKTLTEIKAEIDRLASVIGAESFHEVPTYGASEDFARPHIEVDSRGYHRVVVERGQEISRVSTRDLDELLYQVFQAVTFSVANDYELAHRIQGQDSRRLIFQRQVELLAKLSGNWARREAQEHERILREYPFDDHSGIRAQLAKELREAGDPPDIAWRKACQRYPQLGGKGT